jgi:hypothetical protein
MFACCTVSLLVPSDPECGASAHVQMPLSLRSPNGKPELDNFELLVSLTSYRVHLQALFLGVQESAFVVALRYESFKFQFNDHR